MATLLDIKKTMTVHGGKDCCLYKVPSGSTNSYVIGSHNELFKFVWGLLCLQFTQPRKNWFVMKRAHHHSSSSSLFTVKYLNLKMQLINVEWRLTEGVRSWSTSSSSSTNTIAYKRVVVPSSHCGLELLPLSSAETHKTKQRRLLRRILRKDGRLIIERLLLIDELPAIQEWWHMLKNNHFHPPKCFPGERLQLR